MSDNETNVDQQVKKFREQMDREGFAELYDMQGLNEHGNKPLLNEEQAEGIIEGFLLGRKQAGKPEPTTEECQQLLHYFTVALVNVGCMNMTMKGLLVLDIDDEGEVVTALREGAELNFGA